MSHVVAARLDSNGDVLLMGPAIRAVAAAEDVTLWCGPSGEQAANLLPGVNRVFVAGAAWIDPQPPPVDPARIAQLVGGLAGLRADRALIFTSYHQSPLPTALLLRLAGVSEIAAISEDYPGSLLDVRHRVSDDIHEVQRALSLAAAFGYALSEDDPRLQVLRPARGLPPPAPDPYVVVHPGAAAPARSWGAEECAELVGALVRRGWSVAVTGSPGERALTAYVAGPPQAAVADLGGATTFAELAEVLAGAAAVVVGNTGPAHLAAAVGAPIVSLFAPTVPAARWRPWQVPHSLLSIDVPCAGCRARDCPVPGHPCLGGVTVDQVVDAVEQVAARRAEVQAPA